MSWDPSEVHARRSAWLQMFLGLLAVLVFPAVGSEVVPALVGLSLVFLSLGPLRSQSRAFVIARGLTIVAATVCVALLVLPSDALRWSLAGMALVLSWFLLAGLRDSARKKEAGVLERRVEWIRGGVLLSGGALVGLGLFAKLESVGGGVAVLLLYGSLFAWLATILQIRRALVTPAAVAAD